MDDYTELCKTLRGGAEQMEQHAVSFDIVHIISNCRAAADAIEAQQSEFELHKMNTDRIVQMNSRLEGENYRLKKRLALYEDKEAEAATIKEDI